MYGFQRRNAMAVGVGGGSNRFNFVTEFLDLVAALKARDRNYAIA